MAEIIGYIGRAQTLTAELSTPQTLTASFGGGGTAHGIPAGGEPGQGLIKVSDADYDVKWMSILPEDTASGSVASFPDGADDLPMGVVVDIDPVQDLHGYDNPWPGGGGVNILDPRIKWTSGTYYGLTFTTTDGYHFKYNGTATGSGNIITSAVPSSDAIILPAGAYISRAATVALYKPDGTWIRTQYSNTPFTVDEPFYVRNFYIQIVEGRTYNIENTLELVKGSTLPSSWSPYSNICPISGHDSVNVWNDPKYGGTIRRNQLYPLRNVSYTGTNFTVTSTGDGAFVFVVTATATSTTASNITAVAVTTFTAGHIYAFLGQKYGIKPDLKAFSKYADSVFKCTTPSYSNVTFVFDNLPAGTYRIYPMLVDLTEMFGETKAEEILAMGETAGAAYVKSLLLKDYYEYDTSYEETCVSAVNGDPYRHVTIQLDQTVYGGNLNVTTGELVVDRAIVDLATGMSGGTAGGNYVFFKQLQNALTVPSSQIADIIAEAYKPIRFNAIASTSYHIALRDNGVIYVNTGSADVQPVGNAVYKLATPITLTLDPVEIRSLFGDNNVWADTGDVSVTYLADVQKYIDKKISAAVAAMS